MSGPPPGYIDVAERLRELRAAHPDGCVRPAILERPYTIETIGDKTFIVVVAACYRTPDDMMPGVGMAWEPFPGPTNFTRDSELQNAETSAWGRAIVATLVADTKRISSSDEVRNRQPAPEVKPADPGKLKLIETLFAQVPPGVSTATLDDLLAYATSDVLADATIAKLEAKLDEIDKAMSGGPDDPDKAPF